MPVACHPCLRHPDDRQSIIINYESVLKPGASMIRYDDQTGSPLAQLAVDFLLF